MGLLWDCMKDFFSETKEAFNPPPQHTAAELEEAAKRNAKEIYEMNRREIEHQQMMRDVHGISIEERPEWK